MSGGSFNMGGIVAAFEAKARAAEAALAERIIADCDAYVPYDTGALAASASAAPGQVIYSAPYARIVYYGGGMRFQTGAHPLATAGWVEAAKAVHGEAWVQAVRSMIV